MQAFYAALPDSDSALATIALLHRSAHENHVRLATGEYHVVRQGSSGLQRYQLSFPAQADYRALRNWLAASLNAMPTLALDDISFKRDDAKAQLLDSRVRLTLYLKAP